MSIGDTSYGLDKSRCNRSVPNYGNCDRALGHPGPCAHPSQPIGGDPLSKKCGEQFSAGACDLHAGHLGEHRITVPHITINQAKLAHQFSAQLTGVKIQPQGVLTGGLTNYYLVRVEHPQREGQAPYTAECEDIGEALGLDPNEMNIFKEIWRSANARKGNGKPDHKVLYGAEKIVHYAGRNLRKIKLSQA